MVPPSSESLPSAAPSTVHHFVATPPASRNSSWRCSRIAPRRTPCGPTSCACISPRSLTRCWSCCGAGACGARGWRGRHAARSACSCSRSACGSGSACGPCGYRSTRASRKRASSGRGAGPSPEPAPALLAATLQPLSRAPSEVSGTTASAGREARQNGLRQPRIWRPLPGLCPDPARHATLPGYPATPNGQNASKSKTLEKVGPGPPAIQTRSGLTRYRSSPASPSGASVLSLLRL